MKYTMRVCWMYHDFMDLYGDKGNMMVLKKRCEDRGIEFILDTCGIGEERDLSTYDLIFLGGGADKEQINLIPDLLSRKENIQKAMDEKTFVLLICGGYQLFGQYYIAADNSKIEGLQFYDYYTDTGKEGSRCIGNIIIDANLDGLQTKIIGFENHGGQTLHVKSPLGKVLVGYGNSFEGGYEGFYDGHILGTYLHGPLLPKNPDVADFVIMKSLQKHHPEFKMEDLMPLENEFDKNARQVLIQRLMK
ncbi:MAG: glutamine amidotransferase [Bacillota bacterium]|nr:glutamine amidotransferase [Bacillota bacterium]